MQKQQANTSCKRLTPNWLNYYPWLKGLLGLRPTVYILQYTVPLLILAKLDRIKTNKPFMRNKQLSYVLIAILLP